MEFKSNQWFGATVRSSGDHILVSQGAHVEICCEIRFGKEEEEEKINTF